MKRTFFARFSWPIIAVVAVMFPITVWAAIMALGTNRNDVKEWLPDSFEATRDYKWFQEHFGQEMFVLASWKGCTLADPRLDKLEALLAPSDAPTTSSSFKRVTTGRDLVQQLTSPPINLTRAQAIERLKGSFVGPDGEQTCAAILLSAEGNEDLRAAVAKIYATLTGPLKIPLADIHLGGPPVDNVAIDIEGERMLLRLMGLSAVVGLSLAWWYLREVKLTAMVFVGGVYSAAISLALVYALGGRINSVLLTMPSVVYTAGLSSAIHLINYYRHDRVQHGLAGSAERGVRAAWIPCLLSAGTTSLGLVSLCTSQLIPIRNFGFYTAVGVMVTVAFVFIYLPSALAIWPPVLHRDAHADELSALDPQHRRRMRGGGRGSSPVRGSCGCCLWVWASRGAPGCTR